MSKVRIAFGNKYVLGCTVLLVFMFYMGMRLPEYQRQYRDDGDIIRLAGSDVYEYARGMENLGAGAVLFTETDSDIIWLDEDLVGTASIRFYITELSVSDIRTLVTADGKTGEIFLTKGENIYNFDASVKKGGITVSMFGTEGVRLNWDRVIFEKRPDRVVIPCTLAVILLICLCVMLSAGLEDEERGSRAVCLFFVFVMIFYQTRNVFYYFDDYGYLSLSYQGLYHVSGDMDPADIFAFLGIHYLNWGGRVLYFLFLILYGQNIWVIRLALCIHIFMILYVTGKLVGYEKNCPTGISTAMIPFLLYSLLEVEMMRDGAYWFTAAVLYVFPVLWMLIGIILLYQESFQERKPLLGRRCRAGKILSIPVLFIASCSQEQLGICMAAMVLLATAEFVRKEKRMRLYHIAANTASWAGCAILLGAPGNMERLRQSEGRKTIIECARQSLHIITSDSTKYITFAFVMAVCMVAVTLFRKSCGKVSKAVALIWFFIGSVFALIMVLGGYGMLTALQTVFRIIRAENLNNCGDFVLTVFLTGSWCMLMIWYTAYHKLRIFRWLLVGAAALYGVTLVSPDVSRRMLLPVYLFLIVIIGEIFVNFSAEMKGIKKQAYIVILAAMTAFGGLNYHYILYGYFRNAEAAEYNMEVLGNFDDYADDNKYVLLRKNRDDTFGNMMPYMSGYGFITDYMKEMYGIPQDAILRWAGTGDLDKPGGEAE